jgi:hypothetical protein
LAIVNEFTYIKNQMAPFFWLTLMVRSWRTIAAMRFMPESKHI